MGTEQHFDIAEFVAGLADAPVAERPKLVIEELASVKGQTVRDSAKHFQQQMYTVRLERLRRHLDGQDVEKELNPTERAAYQMLAPKAAPPPPAPPPEAPKVAAVAEPAPEAPKTGPERRQSRRIQMNTRARVRTATDKEGKEAEIIAPVNISRGGICFESACAHRLDDPVFVILHYKPGTSEMETRGMIVRVSPAAGAKTSYGVKFLGGAEGG
jgi:hypothetical protein